MSDTTQWITPLGLKLDVEDINDTDQQLDRFADITKNYHKGKYVIGLDTSYCDRPHYHIHFWAEKLVTKGACKTFRSEKLKMLSRKSKFYTGQDYKEGVDKYIWLAYAVKEKAIAFVGFTPDEILHILALAGVQLEIKRLKNIHSQKQKIKDDQKKELKDKLFEYIKENKEYYALDHKNEFYDKYECMLSYKIPDLIRKLIIKYFVKEDKYWYIQKQTIERYLKEYLGKYENYNEENFFSMLYI